jgi:hypothetical protein
MAGLAIAEQLGYTTYGLYTAQVCTIIFAVISAAFFLTYFLKGKWNWVLLFPALIFAALALTISTILEDPDSPKIAFPFVLSLGIPFYVGYSLNRKRWRLLIPAWVLTITAILPLVSERINADLLAAFFLYSTALPFLIWFLADREREWALITAAVLGFFGSLPLVELVIHGDLLEPVVMFLFTLPFLAIYSASKKNWWALIPSGVFGSIGLVALMDYLFPYHAYITLGGLEIGVYTGLLFLGLAVTFGCLWYLRDSQPTDWARYPAISLLVTSVLGFLMGKSFEGFMPAVFLLVIGIVLLVAVFLKRKVARQPTS